MSIVPNTIKYRYIHGVHRPDALQFALEGQVPLSVPSPGAILERAVLHPAKVNDKLIH